MTPPPRKGPVPVPDRETRPGSERDRLAMRIAKALGISREEAEVRALRELAERIAPEKPAAVDLAYFRSEKARRPRSSRSRK